MKGKMDDLFMELKEFKKKRMKEMAISTNT